MTFGQTIKELRRKKNITQESLAELLSISPQAVSRWETGAAMPDISLLPPIANLFEVSTDYLLGMDTYQKDLRKAEFDEAFFEYWKRDDKEKNYKIALRAVAEYPGNMEYTEWLASAEYYVGIPMDDSAERMRFLESSVRHYKIVLENSADSKLYNKALFGIVFSLHYSGKDEEAMEYAKKCEDESKRDEMLLWCLHGEEKTKLAQKVAERHLGSLLCYIGYAGNVIERCNATERILAALFPDGNYQYFHNTLQYNATCKALELCRMQLYDEAVCELAKARFHALEMVKYDESEEYAFTAPLFNFIKGKKDKTASSTNDFDGFLCCLCNNSSFDPLRERDDFKALFAV